MKTLSAVFDVSKYTWYTYNGKTRNLVSKQGTRFILKKGKSFGTRAASSDKNKVRVIFEDLGPSKVFSFSFDDVQALIKTSNKSRGSKDKNGDSISLKDNDKTDRLHKEYDVAFNQFKKRFLAIGFVTNIRKDAKELKKLLSPYYDFDEVVVNTRSAEKILQAIKNFKFTGKKIRAKTVTAGVATAQLKAAYKTIKDKNHSFLSITDALDHLDLASALAANDHDWIDYASDSMDTSSQENIPMAVWNWIQKHIYGDS